MRLTLDTNVLVYAADRTTDRHVQAAEFVGRAASADCIQTLQSFSECFHVLCRKKRVAVSEARRMLRSFQTLFPVVAAAPADLDSAMDLVERHQLGFWDALLRATARREGCRMILTEDGKDGQSIDGVLLVNPFNPDNARLIDLALPPTHGASP